MAAYTWTGAVNNDYANSGNWSGSPIAVPGLNDDITYSGAVNCNLGTSNRTVKSVTFSGYTGQLQFNSNLIVNGNLTLQATTINTSGTNALIIGATSTITPNGGNWSGNLQIGNATSIVVTLTAGFSVSGTLSFSNTVSLSGTSNLTALTNLLANPSCIVSTPSATPTTIVLGGTAAGTQTWSGTGRIGCNLQFGNPNANYVVQNVVEFGSVVGGSQTPIMNYISGASITTTSSTLNVVGNCLFNTNSVTWNNVVLRTLGTNTNNTITFGENFNVGGNLTQAGDGNGVHTLSRTATQVINLQGNLQVGANGALNGLFASTSSGAEIIVIGKVASPSILGGSIQAVNTVNWCDCNITITAGANSVQLSTTNEFNFGNPSTVTPITYRTFKYNSGTFSAAGSTINLGNTIIDIGAQTFNNVRLYATGSRTTSFTTQLVSNLTITGNLLTGGYLAGREGVYNLQSTGIATDIFIQGGLTMTTTFFNTLQGSINLNFIGSGTLSGEGFCRNNINFNSGTYTIANFAFGKQAYSTSTPPTLPSQFSTMKFNGGSLTGTGTLYIGSVILDIGSSELNNLWAYQSDSSVFNYYLVVKSLTVLRVNGNLRTGYIGQSNPSSAYGGLTINNDSTTSNTKIDVYGNFILGSTTNQQYNSVSGNSAIYMRGTGTISTGPLLPSNFQLHAIDIFIQGVTTTLERVNLASGKKIEYISGGLVTTNSITSIYGVNSGATIKSAGQTWGDVGIRGGATLLVDGNLTCRDLITYNESFNVGIQGVGFIVTIKRNLTIGAQPLLAGNLLGVNPIDKLVMDATDGGTGTWTSGTGQLRISLDLNAPTRTIVVSGTVNFGSQTTQRLRWFATTTMNTTGSTLSTGGATLDLGNQVWGGLTTGTNASVNFESDATFTNVNLTGGGSSMYLNGVTTARNLTIQGNLSISQNTGTFTGFNLVNIIFNGDGTWGNTVGSTLNENIVLAGGTRTLAPNVNWGGGSTLGIGGAKTFSATGGNLNGSTSTYNIIGSNTISVDKLTRGTFHNVTTTANSTITLNAQMGITGTLTLNSLAANITTFASSSTFGWDAVNFTHGGGNSTCILNAGSTYNISGTFTMLGGNAASRATLRSSKLSTFNNATANGTTLTSSGIGGSPVEVGMALSQASVVASDGFAAIYPNRPILTSAGVSPFNLNPSFPVTPSTGPVNMEAGIKANLNLAVSTGVPLILFATVKDINSIGGQTIYAFQTYLDAPGNPQADMFRTINWNTLAPPVSPIGIGYLSIT
jgi:hypothetical protein